MLEEQQNQVSNQLLGSENEKAQTQSEKNISNSDNAQREEEEEKQRNSSMSKSSKSSKSSKKSKRENDSISSKNEEEEENEKEIRQVKGEEEEEENENNVKNQEEEENEEANEDKASSKTNQEESYDDDMPVLPPTYASQTLSPRGSYRQRSSRRSEDKFSKTVTCRDYQQDNYSNYSSTSRSNTSRSYKSRTGSPKSPRRQLVLEGAGPSSPYRDEPFSMKGFKYLIENEWPEVSSRSATQRDPYAPIKEVKVKVPIKRPKKYRPLPDIKAEYTMKINTFSKTDKVYIKELRSRYTEQQKYNPLHDDQTQHRERSIQRTKLLREYLRDEDVRLRKIENREHRRALSLSYSRDVFHGDEMTHPHYPSLRITPTQFRQTHNYNRKAFI